MSVFIVEHKTTSEDISPGADYWKRLRLDTQVSTYHVGARALGFMPDECLYDVVRKPQIRPLKATPEESRKYTKDGRLYAAQRAADETSEEFRIRLRENIAESPDKYYGRGHIPRLEEDERDAAYDAWQTAKNIREAELSSRWPRNPDACVRFGRTCDFFPVCTRESSVMDGTRFVKKADAHVELSGDGKRRLPLVTTSSMRTFRRCAREYKLSYVDNFTSVEHADALRFGTLFHTALEVWWRTVDLDAAFAAMVGAADDFEQVKAEELLRGYHFRWRNEPFNVLAVEREFIAPLVNPDTGSASKTYELGGKIDAIASMAHAEAAE